MNHKTKSIRIIIVWTMVLFVFLFTLKYIDQKLSQFVLENIEIPRNGIVEVDKNSISNLSNGAPEHPFGSIREALEFISENKNFTKILVHEGKYSEEISLQKGISLLGIGKNVNISNPKKTSGRTVSIPSNALVSNLTITGGRYGIFIPPETQGDVILNNIKVHKAGWWGIFNGSSPELSLKIIASEISNSGRQGLYLNESSFYMNNSKIFSNEEEGVDLHIGMSSIIKNSSVLKNGEGGIETELGNNSLLIENCKIESNGSSGINLQSFEKNLTVTIRNTFISNNTNFEIPCAIHGSFSSPYFSRSLANSSDNTFSENGILAIDQNCKL